jgi:TusA-related sulfurtransferase
VACSDPLQPDVVPRLDLRSTPCPINLIRARLTLETVAAGAWLQLELDAGEAERSVATGLAQAGHAVHCRAHPEDSTAVVLLVQAHGGEGRNSG